jgi:integrase
MLTDIKIRTAKTDSKTIRLTDGRGLYLEVTPAGRKHWRYRFRIDGKASIYSIGEYPSIKANEARQLRDQANVLIKQGINPTQAKKLKKFEVQYENSQTFKAVAEEWFEDKSKPWSDGYRHSVRRILDNDLFPHIGDLPIKGITTPIAHQVIKRVEARGAATRTILARQILGTVFKLAILTARANYNIADPLKGQIARCRVQHRRHLERGDIGDFLRKLEDFTGHRETVIAMRVLLMTAVRPGELCGASWAEFDLEQAEWRIPAPRMKMRRPHFVPLSHQAVDLLKELKFLTGNNKYLFPVQGTKAGTIPINTLRNAIRKLGYMEKFSPHGSRGTFSTILNEAGYRPDVIERQLAHAEKNAVRAAYHHAEYLPERIEMMQSWSDMLDNFQTGGKVLAFQKAA